MRVTFLFWNIFKRPLQDRIARIAAVHDVDVIILAECDIALQALLTTLNANAARPYALPFSIGEKLRIFTRLSVPMIDVFNDPIGGLTIRHIRLSPPPDVLLAAVHLPSRVNWDMDDQTLEMPVLASELVRAENNIGTQRTILIGDFNMNPFDPGMVGAQALNAVMTRNLARREDRTGPYL